MAGLQKQAGGLKSKVVLEVSVLPLLPTVTCEETRAVLICLQKWASQTWIQVPAL